MRQMVRNSIRTNKDAFPKASVVMHIIPIGIDLRLLSVDSKILNNVHSQLSSHHNTDQKSH